MTLTASTRLGLDVNEAELRRLRGRLADRVKAGELADSAIDILDRSIQSLSDAAWVINYLADLGLRLQVVGQLVPVTAQGPLSKEAQERERLTIQEAIATIAATAAQHVVVDPVLRMHEGIPVRHVELFVIAKGPPARPSDPHQRALVAKVMEPPPEQRQSSLILPDHIKPS